MLKFLGPHYFQTLWYDDRYWSKILFNTILTPPCMTLTIRGITRTSYVHLPGRKYYIENDYVKIAALRWQFWPTWCAKYSKLSNVYKGKYLKVKKVKNTFCNLYKLFSSSVTRRSYFLLFSTSVYSSLHLIPHKSQSTPGCAGHSLYNCIIIFVAHPWVPESKASEFLPITSQKSVLLSKVN